MHVNLSAPISNESDQTVLFRKLTSDTFLQLPVRVYYLQKIYINNIHVKNRKEYFQKTNFKRQKFKGEIMTRFYG